MTRKQRILIISHGHPEFGSCCTEITAYTFFKELDNLRKCRSIFLARHDQPTNGHGGTPFSVRDAEGKEVLLYSRCDDHFLFSQPVKRLVWHYFREFLEDFKPTIVHFHHYLYLGIELIREVRKYSEKVPIILTLHEYHAICHNHGQMVKTHNQKLCFKATHADCHQCFPNKTPEDFFLRESYIKSFFKLVDRFISPSKFLIDRYVAWGLPRNRIIYLENGQVINNMKTNITSDINLHTRFAFFGQLSAAKGLETLLEAIVLLPKNIQDSITLDIYGSNLRSQPEKFKKYVQKKLNELRKQVRFHGSYRVDEIDNLMAKIGWVIVPSNWWENSPVVIQESFKNHRPLICSDIGGMAEKVQDGITGIHFRTRDSIDLADKITEVVKKPQLWNELSSNIVTPISIKETAIEHLKLYNKLIDTKEQLCA